MSLQQELKTKAVTEAENVEAMAPVEQSEEDRYPREVMSIVISVVLPAIPVAVPRIPVEAVDSLEARMTDMVSLQQEVLVG